MIAMMAQMHAQLAGGEQPNEEQPVQLQNTSTPPVEIQAPAPQPQAQPEPAQQPSAQFTIGPGSAIRPVSANLPDVSNESIPLELDAFSEKYKIVYGQTGWEKSDGSQLTLKDEAIAERRKALLGDYHYGSVMSAANNARAAGTTLTTENMKFFLGDGTGPKDGMTLLRRMNPEWVPGQGPPPQFEPGGKPIPGTVGSMIGGINMSSSSGTAERWPHAPATNEQLREYDRRVATLRAHQFVVSTGDRSSLPPPADPRTIELVAQKNGRVSIDTLNDLASRWTLDAMRYEAAGGNVSAGSTNVFANNQPLFDAYKKGDFAAFSAALGR